MATHNTQIRQHRHDPGADHRHLVLAPQQTRIRQQHMRSAAPPAPRSPRSQPAISRPTPQHTLASVTPRSQHPATRRTRQQPTSQLSLHRRHLDAYDQHGCHLRHPREPSLNRQAQGGLSHIQERAHPANTKHIMPPINGTTAASRAGFKRRSTPGRANRSSPSAEVKLPIPLRAARRALGPRNGLRPVVRRQESPRREQSGPDQTRRCSRLSRKFPLALAPAGRRCP